MLAQSFEFFLQNDAGAEIAIGDVDISYQPWKFGPTGTLTYGTAEPLTNAGAIANASVGSCGSVDNSVNLNLGAHLGVTINATASGTGSVTLYMRILNADRDTMALVSVTDITTQKTFGVEI